MRTRERRLPTTAPPVVHQALRRPGRALDPTVRREAEQRLGHSLGGVRIHDDELAARSAEAVRAAAYTVGRHVVFGAGRFSPRSPRGRTLLTHELSHVIQQGASEQLPTRIPIGRTDSPHEGQARASGASILAARPSVGAVAAGTLQRQDEEEDEYDLPEIPDFQLPEPTLRYPAPTPPSFQLQIDPEIQAQIAAIRMLRRRLDPARVARAAGEIDLTVPAPTPPEAASVPAPTGTAVPTPVPQTTPAPLVPRGAGPATPRAGTMGDVVGAIMKIPAVSNGLDRLQEEAASTARREWRRLSGVERGLLIGQSILIGGTALTAILANDESRTFVLDQLQGRPLPVPGVGGLTIQLNITGPEQRVFLGLDVARVLRGD